MRSICQLENFFRTERNLVNTLKYLYCSLTICISKCSMYLGREIHKTTCTQSTTKAYTMCWDEIWSSIHIFTKSRAAVAKRTKAANFSQTGSGFEPCIYRFRKDFNTFMFGTQNRLIQYKCLKSRRAGPPYCMDGPKTYKR